MQDLPAVFARTRRLLRRGARFYVSESCFRNAAIQAEFDARPGTDFVRNSIFGNGRLRPLSELVAAAETSCAGLVAVLGLAARCGLTRLVAPPVIDPDLAVESAW